MDKKQVVDQTRAKLEEIGLPQAWAARQVGVTPAYFNRVVSGGLLPSDDLCLKIAKLLQKLKTSGLTRAV